MKDFVIIDNFFSEDILSELKQYCTSKSTDQKDVGDWKHLTPDVKLISQEELTVNSRLLLSDYVFNKPNTPLYNNKLIKKKREILSIYKKKLSSVYGISMNPELKNTVNGAWMPTVVFAKKTNVTQNKLLKAFAKENIDARVFFWPLSKLKMFKPVKKNFNACIMRMNSFL